MMYKEYGMGRHSFNKEKRKEFQEKWSKMTNEEKLEFANKRFGKKERFSVEKLDEFTEKWTKMSVEEKEAYVEERKERFKEWKHRKHMYSSHKKGCGKHRHKRRGKGRNQDAPVIININS